MARMKSFWIAILFVLTVLGAVPAMAQTAPTAVVIPPEVLQAAAAAEAANGTDIYPGSTGIRADFTLTSMGDTVDIAPGDGTCADAGAGCTLRAAIMEANTLGGTHTITIPSGYAISLTLGVPNDNNANSGDIDIYADITINGTGPGFARIENTLADRIFHLINPGSKLSLKSMTLTKSGGELIAGGAVLANGGEFYADQINVTSNTGLSGGGIALSATIFEIRSSTFMDNTGHGNGGALNIQNGSTGAIINTSIFGNHSVVTGSSFYPGGGLFVYGPADVDLIHSTITANHNSAYGGGLSVYNLSSPTAPLTITNSVISGNSTNFAGPDCYLFDSASPKVAFAGMNMFGEIDQYCAVSGDPAVTIGEVDLGSLAGTNTSFAIPLADGSAAINAAPSCPAELLGVDQAGEVRPVGPACDLGAMEHFAGETGALDVSPSGGEPLSSFTVTVTDLDLVALSTIDVQAITRNTLYPDSETITLAETAPGSGTFNALVLLGAAPATSGNGTIEAGLGHEVVITYWDAVTADADGTTLEATYAVVSLPAANLLTNGDFEAGAAGWTIVATNGDKVKSQNPFDGLKAFKFKGGAGKLPASLSQTVLNPAVADGDTLYAQAMISSGPAASGKMLLNIKTSTGRQVKASVVYAKNGAYALHFIQVPLLLDSGETVAKAILRFTDASQSGKVYVDAVSLSVQVPNDPRANSRSGVMPPPPQPDGFRGQN